jgi:hypothetical protein
VCWGTPGWDRARDVAAGRVFRLSLILSWFADDFGSDQAKSLKAADAERAAAAGFRLDGDAADFADPLTSAVEPLLPLLNRFTLIQFKGPTDALQQVEQFRRLGEVFAMQHNDVKYMGEVEEELQMAVLEAIPPEKRCADCRRKSDCVVYPSKSW